MINSLSLDASARRRSRAVYGNPDTVSRKLEKLFESLPAEYFWLFTYNGLVPQPQMMRHLELLTTKVLPHFTDTVK